MGVNPIARQAVGKVKDMLTGGDEEPTNRQARLPLLEDELHRPGEGAGRRHGPSGLRVPSGGRPKPLTPMALSLRPAPLPSAE